MERIDPRSMDPLQGLWLEHLTRYSFAADYCKGRVLDIACGVGYGSFMIARYCKKTVTQVRGVDICSATIKGAQRDYHHPKCQYLCHDATDPKLPEKLGSFDTILSFETLEHLPCEKQFLKNITRMLHPKGTLVLSTPLGRGREYPSKEPFHYFQLTREEFENLLPREFQAHFFYQRSVVVYPQYEDKCAIGIVVAKRVSSS